MSYRDGRRRFLFKRQDGICPLCEAPMDEGDVLNRNRLTVDHKIPVSHGGPDSVDNQQLTHRPCNSAKGCGCEGDRPDHGPAFRQRLWREQGFVCGEAGDPILPSDLNDRRKVKLSGGMVSHVRCLYEAGLRRGSRNLEPPVDIES